MIILSAIELGIGSANFSNQLALDGFYFLVIGIVLQIISSLTYGNAIADNASSDLPRKIESTRRFKIMVSIAAIAVLSISTIGIYSGAITNNASLLTGYTTISSPTTSRSTHTGFQASAFFSKILPEPQNESLVTFGIVATGGSPPYEYEAVWSDGVTQSNNYGTFSRTIQSGVAIPSSATVTVTSSNGKNVTFVVQIPKENVSTSSTISQAVSSLTFVEDGLAPTHSWSVEINSSQESSKSNEIVFPNLKSGNYNFSVSLSVQRKF